jgi:pimeloyl-[acyl-carrier protein] methyl ester esterase
VAAALAPHLRVHCVDLPGHGASATCTPYTLDAIAERWRKSCRPAPGLWLVARRQLALTWAQRAPRQVTRLVLIAGTPRFVNGADWTHGIDPEVLDAFAADLERDLHRDAAAFSRAAGARRCHDAREVLRQLRRKMLQRPASDVAALAAGLRIL